MSDQSVYLVGCSASNFAGAAISPHTPARWRVVRDVRLGVGLGLEAQGVPAWPRGAAVPPRCAQQGAPATASLARCRAAPPGPAPRPAWHAPGPPVG